MTTDRSPSRDAGAALALAIHNGRITVKSHGAYTDRCICNNIAADILRGAAKLTPPPNIDKIIAEYASPTPDAEVGTRWHVWTYKPSSDQQECGNCGMPFSELAYSDPGRFPCAATPTAGSGSREGLVSALAYALARAELPDKMEGPRDYAKRLAPLIEESGWLNPSEGAREQELRQALLNVALAYTPDGPCYCDPPDTGEPHDPRCDAARRLLASNQRAEGQEGSGQG